MELRLYTLSPLHIGTGETLSPMDYIVNGKMFYRIGQDELYKLVQQLPDGPRLFSGWIEEQFAAMRDLRDNREQSRLSNRTNALAFFEQQGKKDFLLKYLQARPEGGQSLQLDDQNRQRGRTDHRFGEVREAIRTNQLPYLPGTSIKGAVRTALLYDYLLRHGDIAQLEYMFREQLNNRRVRKEYFAAPLEAQAFFCGMNEKGRTRNQEAQMDLLKWLAVSDAHPVDHNMRLQVGKINLYLVEKEQTRDRKQTPRLLASRQPQSSYAEMIPAGQGLSAQLNFDGTTLAFLLRKAGTSSITVKKNKDTNEYYQHLRKKVKQLFNLSNDLLDQADAQQLSNAIENHCQKALTNFSKAQLKRQEEWLEDYRTKVDKEDFGPRIAAGFVPVNAYQGQLMHLGYAAGFSATTALLFFLENNNLSALYERIMDYFQLGRAPKQKGRYTPNIRRFPKSRRFVESENSIQPLGWVAMLGAEETPPNITPPSAGDGNTSSGPSHHQREELENTEPTYFTGSINYKNPPELDAVVTKAGRPNKVKVYLAPDNCPELDLQAYRTPLEVGTIVIVKSQFNKRKELLSVSYFKTK
jgi:CRISPR/Cas system CSM-associated protein Csm5 (group 7 of RAMP superfamily)